jgi:hypothetical protein
VTQKGQTPAPAMSGLRPVALSYTVQDAALQRSPELRLIHQHLESLPPGWDTGSLHHALSIARYQELTTSHATHVCAGLAALKHLRTLDCSDNPLKQLDGTQLPPGVQQATFTGCHITALPQNLSVLTNLQQLFLSANHLADISPIWSCPALLHVSLSYNSVSAITAPPAVLQQCPIVSLDLSHNDITRVTSVAPSLSLLPKLQALGIKGNPLCLDPSKRAALLRCLPLLQYVDNQVGPCVDMTASGMVCGNEECGAQFATKVAACAVHTATRHGEGDSCCCLLACVSAAEHICESCRMAPPTWIPTPNCNMYCRVWTVLPALAAAVRQACGVQLPAAWPAAVARSAARASPKQPTRPLGRCCKWSCLT